MNLFDDRDRKGDLYPGLSSEIFLYLNRYRPQSDWRTVLIFTQRRFDPGLPLHYQETVLVYKFPSLTTQEIEAMLGLGELKQTRVYQEAQQDAIASMTLRQLKHRFGDINPDLETQIRALPIAQAEELTEALLDFSTLNDLLTWLQTHPTTSN